MAMLSPLQEPGRIKTSIQFWPSFVDVLVTVLMVFILQMAIQSNMNVKNLEAARLQQAQQSLRQALDKEFKNEVGKSIFILTAPNLLQIRFSNSVLFGTGKYQLESVGEKMLSRCARVLSLSVPASLYQEIQVEGHTDPYWDSKTTQFPRNNWELSTARALSVVSYLVSNSKLDPAKLSANGFAEYRPILDEKGERNDELSRRIELRIVFTTPGTGRG